MGDLSRYSAVAICLCLIILYTTAVRVYAIPIVSQLETQAHNFYDQGNYAKVILVLKQLLKTNPGPGLQTIILTNLGSAEMGLYNYTGALYHYKKSLSINPHHIGALLGVGEILEHFGNQTGAIKYFKEAIAQKPKAYEQTEIANVLFNLGNYSQAINIANQVLKQDPTDVEALSVKGDSYLYLGNNSEALNVFNTLISQGDNGSWTIDNRGVALLGLYNYVAALANFNDAIKLTPDDAYVFFNRAEAALNIDFYSQNIHTLQEFKQQKQIIVPHIYDALKDLNKGLIIDPKDTQAFKFKSLLVSGIQRGWLKP